MCAQDYADVNINNFTTAWSDGLAFLALIHRFRPDLFDYELVSRKTAHGRLEYAFRVANKTLGIARLLDPEGPSALCSPRPYLATCHCPRRSLHSTFFLHTSNGFSDCFLSIVRSFHALAALFVF